MSNHDRKGPPSRGDDAADNATRDTVQETALKRAWQQASDEEPPRELDAAIIAAARKSVQDRGTDPKVAQASPKSRHRWMQWQPLAAAATVASLAFALVQLMPRDRDVAPSIRMEEPVRGDATAEEKQAATAPAATVPAPQAKVEAPDYDNADTTKASEPPVTTEMPATATTTLGATAMPSIEADQRGAVASEMAGPTAPAAAAAPAPARERNAGNAATPGAADRAANIAALYASGDVSGAAEALRAFRAADPQADTYLPDSLRDWAATVR